MSSREYEKKHDRSTTDPNHVSDEALRSLNAERLMQSEISAITGLASGSVTYSISHFDTRMTLPAGTQPGPEALGKIEYRFEPSWWLDSINERMKLSMD